MIASKSRLAAALVLCGLGLAGLPARADAPREVRVNFAPGAQSETVEASITGDEVVDYLLNAREGQYANVSLAARTGSIHFNVIPPDAEQWEAVFVGSRDGRQFEGVLDRSGDWTVRVYQMGQAADGGETHGYRLEMIVAADQERPGSGGVAGAGTPASPEEGGPRRWRVTASGGLRMRGAPSLSAPVIETLANGAILSNLGCTRAEGRVWCDVQPFRGGARGYVAAEYLEPSVAPHGAALYGADDSALRAGRGDFDATGTIPCSRGEGQPRRDCDFGVARGGGGDATVVVTLPGGFKRTLFFARGEFVSTDASQAGGGFDVEAEKRSDLHLIRVDDERYEIPDAVIFGG